jgi:hypothetical protein
MKTQSLAMQIRMTLPPGIRWQVRQRLEEISIAAACPLTGALEAEVSDCGSAIQVWSVGRQFLAPRRELIIWLESCWDLSSVDSSQALLDP